MVGPIVPQSGKFSSKPWPIAYSVYSSEKVLQKLEEKPGRKQAPTFILRPSRQGMEKG